MTDTQKMECFGGPLDGDTPEVPRPIAVGQLVRIKLSHLQGTTKVPAGYAYYTVSPTGRLLFKHQSNDSEETN